MFDMKPRLDKKDMKILEQLEIDARQSNAQIARKTGLSKDAVGYRIKNLEKQKIILGYYSVLNISKLGRITYKLMLTFQNTSSKIEDEIINHIKESKVVGWVVSCDGYYNLMAVTWVKNSFEFDNFLKGLLKKYSKYIRERDIIAIIENHACGRAYLFDKNKDTTPDIYYGGELENEIDEKNLQIIKLLADNAKIPLYKIAGSLNLTAEAIAHRIKQLKQKEIIQAFRPIINTSILGYENYNILFRLKKFDKLEKMFDFFKSHPNITYFVKYLGDYDIGIDLEVKNAEELRTLIKEIKNLFSEDIESHNQILIYQEHKLSYFPEQ